MAFDLVWLAVVFLIVAVIAYALGARNLAWFTADMAKMVFWIFVVLFVVTMIYRLVT